MHFREDPHDTENLKACSLNELETLINRREDELGRSRHSYCKNILTNRDTHRKYFCDLLGWPLNTDIPRPTPVCEVIETIGDEGDYTLSRMRIEVMDGFWLTGLFLHLKTEENRPLVIATHGGGGTPELISGFYSNGSDGNYNGMVVRLLPYRVHIFMPSLLLWNPTVYGQPFDRIAVDGRLKRVGGSITALEIYSITRALDYFEDALKPRSFGMVGLSYGGMYTLFTTAIETRIRSAVSSSFFSERRAYCWPDWSWKNAAAYYDDAEIACLCYPRRICVEMGDHDELFAVEHTQAAANEVKAYAKEAGIDPNSWFDCLLFDGAHEYGHMEEPLARMVRELEV